MSVENERDPAVVRARLLDLFTRAQAALAAYHERMDIAQAFAKTPPPPRPAEVLDIQEWMTYQDANTAHTEQKARIERAEKLAREAWETTEREVIKMLPPGVWFKVGAYGIGIAHTNWGGNKHYVVIEPWKSPMDSLNRKYTGD